MTIIHLKKLAIPIDEQRSLIKPSVSELSAAHFANEC